MVAAEPAGTASRELTYREAVARAIAQEMERDHRVVLVGDPPAWPGLRHRFGAERVRDVGGCGRSVLDVAMDAVRDGLRPVAEVDGAGFYAACGDLAAHGTAGGRPVRGATAGGSADG